MLTSIAGQLRDTGWRIVPAATPYVSSWRLNRVTLPQHPAAQHPAARHHAAQPLAGPPAAAPTPALTIDALGRKCPIPIIMLAERIREVPVGQVIAVLADDPATQSDVPAWCMLKSQEFVMATDLPGQGWTYLVRRSY